MNDELRVSVDYLPLSVNKYLAPRIQRNGNKMFPVMYETKESKDWKSLFRTAIIRSMKDQNFSAKQTKDGFWFLDCGFTLKRKNQDCNNFFKIMIDAMVGIAANDDKNILPRVQWLKHDPKNPETQIRFHRADDFQYQL